MIVSYTCLLLYFVGYEVSGHGDRPILRPITKPVLLAEGPFWVASERVLYYVDGEGQELHRLDPVRNIDYVLNFNQRVGFVIPLKDQRNKFVLGLGLDLVMLTWDWMTGFHSVCKIITVDNMEVETNGLNDGKADAKGRVWAGTISLAAVSTSQQDGLATLYRLDNQPGETCQVKAAVAPVTISNGLVWSLDNTILYYIDSFTYRIDRFDYNISTGAISNRQPVFMFGDLPGNPDGMTIDADGNLWVACNSGGQVIQVDPCTGRLLRQIKFPVSSVTSVTFGGDDLQTLYVTTERSSLTDQQLREQPLAGAVFEVTNLKVTGTAAYYAVISCVTG